MELLNVGYGNIVPRSRVVAVLQPDSSPIKRLREEAVRCGKLLDATQGRRTRAILVLDTAHVVLSAVQVSTLTVRLSGDETEEKNWKQSEEEMDR